MIINPKHCTSVSLAVKPMCFFPVKFVPYSELMIFIGYENNSYYFIHYIPENIIFCSIYAIFDKKLFPKYTNSHTKEYKLYNKLLNKISLETELLASDLSRRNALVSIPHIPISPIQNNSPTCSSLPSLFYKSISLLPTLESKKPIVEIEKEEDVDSDVEMQPLSSQ